VIKLTKWNIGFFITSKFLFGVENIIVIFIAASAMPGNLENISCFDEKIDMEKATRCAQIASIHNEILSMPMQYNTLVGDMGDTLSGGQKQRVILARALYRDPKILFMDEATSSLDAENESLINEHIAKLEITRVIVAHRKETIEACDRIIHITSYQGAGAE